MNNKKTLAAFCVGVFAFSAFGSGFGLYEPSAKYHAMGGAVVGKAIDASANFANPATLTDLTNIEITVGFVTEHPRSKVSVNGEEKNMDPGLFWLPHVMIAVPLPYDFAFGLGLSAEYGLGSEYSEHWPMQWSCYETTVQGLVLNPNLAYKITDKWSVGAGIRLLYFDFEQYRNMYLGSSQLGYVPYHLKGDNGCEDLGWQIGTKYDILDNLSVGLVYKSAIDVHVDGKTRANTSGLNAAGKATLGSTVRAMNDDADADLTLPQSITGGINWDPFETWHLGVSLSWTEWSELDELVFNVQPQKSTTKLDWQDTWRGSIGSAWDFAEDWSWMVSYTYDMDCTQSDQESAMLPPASRHIVATGFAWDIGWGVEATLSYACIFMNGFDMHTEDVKGNTGKYTLKTKRGFCHAGGFSLTYRF